MLYAFFFFFFQLRSCRKVSRFMKNTFMRAAKGNIVRNSRDLCVTKSVPGKKALPFSWSSHKTNKSLSCWPLPEKVVHLLLSEFVFACRILFCVEKQNSSLRHQFSELDPHWVSGLRKVYGHERPIRDASFHVIKQK